MKLWFIIIVLFLFFLLRLPSLYEPLWYGDEGITFTVASAINNGKLLYRDIVDNKPPLLYILYALLNSDLFAIKLASLVFGLFSVVVFFYLSKKLFSNKVCFFTTSIFAFLFAIPIIEGNIANAENFMILPTLLAALLTLNQSHKKKFSIHLPSSIFHLPLLTAGLLLGISFLFKAVALFDFLALFFFLLITNWKHIKKNLSMFLLGFAIPVLVTVLFFLIKGAFEEFFIATFVQNVGYINYANALNTPFNLLSIKLIALASFAIYLFLKRKSVKSTTLFILIWFAFSLFNAFFAQRPYAHYLLTLLPSFSLMLGLIFWDKIYKKILAILFIVSFIFVLNNFSFYKKTFGYYQNFILFLAGKKTVASYQGFFDKKTPTDYEIALFIKPKLTKSDSIFVWGDNPQVYQMTGKLPPGKYTVAYHILNYKDGLSDTSYALKKTKPKFVIIMPDQKPLPFLLTNYSPKINIGDAFIYEKVF